MRMVVCGGARQSLSGETVGSGEFRYKLDFSWAKWPEGLSGLHVLSGSFDEEGRLYAATEDREHPVVIFQPNGEYIRSIGAGLFQKAHSAVHTADRTVLVADSGKDAHVIREITRDGELVRDFGTMGVPGDSGYDINYLEVLKAEGRVPEDPVWNKRAAANARLDSVRKMGSPFCRPCSMAVNDKGEYFAADGYGNDAVHKFSHAGTYAFSWGGPGSEPGKFRLVHDIQIDVRGRVWVADRENRRVQIFDQEGTLLAVIAGDLMRIGGVWTDEGRAYIGELDGGITILDLDLNVKARLGGQGSVIHAHGITGGPQGEIFVFTNKKNAVNILRLIPASFCPSVHK